MPRFFTLLLLGTALASAGCGGERELHGGSTHPSGRAAAHRLHHTAPAATLQLSRRGWLFDAYSINVDGSGLRPLHIEGGGFARSADGRIALLVGQPPFDRGLRLAVMNDDASNLRILRRADQGWDTPTPPAWSSDGRTLAVSDGDCPGAGAADLCISRIDLVDAASGARTATIHGMWNPSWSPDGARLAFETMYEPPVCGSCETTPVYVYVSQPDGRARHRLVRGSGVSWSPTDDLLAYYDSNVRFVHLVRPDGSANRIATHLRVFSWSPDGTRLAVEVPCRDDRPGICLGTLSLKTGRVTPITLSGEAVFTRHFAWSPDSSTVAWGDFDSRHDEERLMIEPASGIGAAREIFRVPRPLRIADNSLIFTKDGKRLLFTIDGVRK